MKKLFKVLTCIAGALVLVRLVQNLVEYCISTFDRKYYSSSNE